MDPASKKKKITLMAAVISLAAVAFCMSFYDIWPGAEMIAGVSPAVIGKDELKDGVPGEREPEVSRILIVGDIMYDRYIRQINSKGGDYCRSFEKVSDFLKGFDLVVANNEGPITDKESVSLGSKEGERENYIFTLDPKVLECYKKNNIRLVSLGNNHIFDFGREGAEQTISRLNDSGIAYFGDPLDESRNSNPYKTRGNIVSFVSYSDFFGPDEGKVIEEIREKDKISDLVIVYCHWGKEYENSSSESQRKKAHDFIDAGANLVIGGHPHVIQDQEVYKGKRIYYSLGNFIFDQYFSAEAGRGLGLEIDIRGKEVLEFNEYRFKTAGEAQLLEE